MSDAVGFLLCTPCYNLANMSKMEIFFVFFVFLEVFGGKMLIFNKLEKVLFNLQV